jgi:hypothetical protein
MLLQVLEADPGSHELLSELLLPHLRSFIPDSSSREQPPLLLHQCAGLVHVSAYVMGCCALLHCKHIAADTGTTMHPRRCRLRYEQRRAQQYTNLGTNHDPTLAFALAVPSCLTIACKL